MSTTNTPDFIVYGVTTRDKGKKDILTRLGAAWKHGKGDGINAQIQALPLNFEGKIVLPAEISRSRRSARIRGSSVLNRGQSRSPHGRAAAFFNQPAGETLCPSSPPIASATVSAAPTTSRSKLPRPIRRKPGLECFLTAHRPHWSAAGRSPAISASATCK